MKFPRLSTPLLAAALVTLAPRAKFDPAPPRDGEAQKSNRPISRSFTIAGATDQTPYYLIHR